MNAEAIIAITAALTVLFQVVVGAVFYGKLVTKVDLNKENTNLRITEVKAEIAELRKMIWQPAWRARTRDDR